MTPRRLTQLARSLHYLGKINLSDRGPQLLGQQVMIVPRPLFTRLIELYEDDPEMERAIYEVMKRAVYDFCAELDDAEDMDPATLLQTLMRLTKLNGYGHIEISDYAEEEHTTTFFVRKLPSENADATFKGDTYWAGMLAGGMSYVFDRDVDALETQCILEGSNSCRFLVAPRSLLQEEYPGLYEEKLAASVSEQIQEQAAQVVWPERGEA